MTDERRQMVRREGDQCPLTHDQLEELLRKVEHNYEMSKHYELTNERLESIEGIIKRICGTVRMATKAVISILLTGVSALIVAVYHLVRWLQEIIDHTLVIT